MYFKLIHSFYLHLCKVFLLAITITIMMLCYYSKTMVCCSCRLYLTDLFFYSIVLNVVDNIFVSFCSTFYTYKHNDFCSISFNNFSCCFQGMTKLPDFKKIEFPSVPPIPMEEVVPEASPEVCHEICKYCFE